MKKLDRQPPPPFWTDRVCDWVNLLVKQGPPNDNKLHTWSRDRRTLASWFHETVRPSGEGAFCAYCDGLLDTQSPKTIDHWVPQDRCIALALWWGNLFPACYGCQKEKGANWSVRWLRPDVDDVEKLITCELATGELKPADDIIDGDLKERVQETIDGLGLNRAGLVRERWRILSRLYRDPGRPLSMDDLLERVTDGPYRFLSF